MRHSGGLERSGHTLVVMGVKFHLFLSGSYGSELPPSLVSQAVTGVNYHLV
jgi:hypothetical protein